MSEPKEVTVTQGTQAPETVIIVQAECSPCKATGVYKDPKWRDGTGVVCVLCNGSGMIERKHTPFTSRKRRSDITTVFAFDQSGNEPYIHDKNTPTEGTVTYEEFLSGKMPLSPSDER